MYSAIHDTIHNAVHSAVCDAFREALEEAPESVKCIDDHHADWVAHPKQGAKEHKDLSGLPTELDAVRSCARHVPAALHCTV